MYGVLVLLYSLLVAAAGKPNITTRGTRLSSRQKAGRVINGLEANLGQFPFHAHIRNGDEFIYSGSLISPTAVLTSAYCIAGRSKWVVTLGYVNSRENNYSWTSISKRARAHPQYNTNYYHNNIGIVFLNERAPENRYIQMVPLLRSEEIDDFAGQTAFAAGWGRTNHSYPYVSDTLNWIVVDVICMSVCRKHYDPGYIIQSTLCTSWKCMNICEDSGAPLVITSGDKFKLIGLASLSGCEDPKPSVFTRVSSFYKWIKSNIEDCTSPSV